MARPRTLLAASLFVLALGLLLVNDWHWKAHPTALTGKLSDLAGLFLVPLPLWTQRALLKERLSWATPARLAALVAVVFVLAKTLPWAARLLEAVWPWPAALGPAHIVCDPSDLLALPLLAAGHWSARALWSPAARPPEGARKPRTSLLPNGRARLGEASEAS